MRVMTQNLKSGRVENLEIPVPAIQPHEVLIFAEASVISAGTERMVAELARKSLLGKAIERPADVKRLLAKAKQEGAWSALRQARAKLDESIRLGYSMAGTVVECGAGVMDFRPGDRVAAVAPHGEVAVVGQNLCATIPERVPICEAAYTSVAAIALQGVRLMDVTLGSRVLVVGLGLIGLIAVGLLKAAGCRVAGIDVDQRRGEVARRMGAEEILCTYDADRIRVFHRGAGVDAVVITAATRSNEPVEFAAECCRHRGKVVLVGVAGLELPRDPFFKKELTFTVSHSLGAGRSDSRYEELGWDYPIGYARWTVKRNMEAVLGLLDRGLLSLKELTTHTFRLQEAESAYELLTSGKEHYIGLQITYGASERVMPSCLQGPAVKRSSRRPDSAIGVSVIGAGNFARVMMMPLLARQSGLSFRGICTPHGFSGASTGEKYGFAFCTTDIDNILRDDGTAAVLVCSRHDSHAELVTRALRAGKHVFVEKPLCINEQELAAIEECVNDLGDRCCPVLMAGFNRRFACAIAAVESELAGVLPLSIMYRFSVAALEPEHWTQTAEAGGRIIGEACHAIDTCTRIAGSVPVRVFAEAAGKVGDAVTPDDRVFITLRHSNGSISAISYQSGGDRCLTPERIEIFGGGRAVVIDGWRTVEVWRAGRRRTIDAHKDKGHAREIATFIDACRSGEWPVPWSELRAVSWAAIAAANSLRVAEPISSGI